MLSHTSDYEEPTRYRTYADEEGYPGDLEYWGQELIPEYDNLGEEIQKGKTKTLSNGHHRLFDNES